MRNRGILVLVLSLTISSLGLASTCTTVAAGAFTAPSVWDCGCSPLLCDTLVISHAVIHTGNATWTNPRVHIEAGGSLTVNGTLVLTGTVVNMGELTADRSTLGDSASTLTNTGTISGDNLYLNADSIVNTGQVLATDTVAIGMFQRFINAGDCLGVFLWTAHTTNSGTLIFQRIGIDDYVDNSGLIRAEQSLIVFDTLHNQPGGYLDVDSLMSRRRLWNNSFMNIRRWLLIDADGSFDTGASGQAFCNGNFYNYGLVKGFGDLCIRGISANYGDIVDSPDICDATLFSSSPPYLDLNLGNVGAGVNWCPSANCSTLGIATNLSPALTISPNPATDHLTITGLPGSGPWNVQLFDLQGRAQAVRTEKRSEGVVLHRDGLAAGCYTVMVVGDTGSQHSAARVVFVDP